MRIASLLITLLVLSLIGCESPAQTRAANHHEDRQGCANYEYAPGSDAFAGCMMHRSDHREYKKDRDEANLARIRQKALERSGDTRYPICSAADMSANLDTAGNFWYAEGCRAR